MTAPERSIGEQELNSYIDGQLDPEQRAVVEQHLASHPDIARRIAADIAHRNALRAAFAGHLTRPLPPELNLHRLIEERLQRRPVWWRIAAAVVLSLGVGRVGG